MYKIKIENFINKNQNLKIDEKTFQKLMFIYSSANKELLTKIEILQEGYQLFYNYKLIDNIITRIKTPKSIINKMQKKNLNLTYKNMIENINDIAGLRIICPSKKDIFKVKELIKKNPEIKILKEKDYVTHPKESGYSSYHLIIETPIILSKATIYAKAEIQIRTAEMDFWANLEHKLKYKPEEK